MRHTILFYLGTVLLLASACKQDASTRRTPSAVHAEDVVSSPASKKPTRIALTATHGCVAFSNALQCWQHTSAEEDEAVDKSPGHWAPALEAKKIATAHPIDDLIAGSEAFYLLTRKGIVERWVGSGYSSRVEVFTGATGIAQFEDRACAVIGESRVECVVASEQGMVPEPEMGKTFEKGVDALAVGGDHACAVFEDRTMSCWGRPDSTIALAPGEGAGEQLRDVKKLVLGRDFTCAILNEDDLTCWGGIFSPDEQKENPFRAKARDIHASHDSLCVLTDHLGKVSTACHMASATKWMKPTPLKAEYSLSYILPSMLEAVAGDRDPSSPSFESFALVGENGCVITHEGEVRCHDVMASTMSSLRGHEPREVKGLSNVEDVLAFDQATLVRDSDGAIWWMGGSGKFYTDGAFNLIVALEPTRVVTQNKKDHSAEVLVASRIKKRGDRTTLVEIDGEWFDYDRTTKPLSLLRPDMTSMETEGSRIVTHPESSWLCAFSGEEDARITCHESYLHDSFEANFEGVPIQLYPLEDSGICLLSNNGKLFCREKKGGKLEEQPLSKPLTAATSSCKLYEGGKLECIKVAWVERDGEFSRVNKTIAMEGITQVQSYGSKTCAIDEAGKLYCVGDNKSGSLGRATRDGDSTKLEEFTLVEGLPAISRVFMSNTHTCALSKDRALWCWGENKFGATGAPYSNRRDVAFEQ